LREQLAQHLRSSSPKDYPPISGVFTIGPLWPWPPLNWEKFRMWPKCNFREVAPIP